MGRSRAHVLMTVSAMVAVSALGGCTRGGGEPPTPAITVVHWSVPEHELLGDVLIIDEKRSKGAVNFSYVPETRPAGLTGMGAHVVESTTVDSYRFAGVWTDVMAEFAREPTQTCEGRNADPGGAACIREERLSPANEPALRNLTVYCSQGSPGSTNPDPAAAEGVREFWSTVKLVPVPEAAWFTDLLERAKAAPKITAG